MRRLKKILSGVIASTIVGSLFSFVPIVNAENTQQELFPYTLFGAAENMASVNIDSQHITLNGSIASNGTFTKTASSGNINGNITENAKMNMLMIHDRLWSMYFADDSTVNYENNVNFTDNNISINDSVKAEGAIDFTGNSLSVNAGIMSLNDIYIGCEVKNSHGALIYSQVGDILIDTTNVNFNGLIYAPFGTVEIDSKNIDINGTIIAQNIILKGESVNINYSISTAEKIGIQSDDEIIADEPDIIDIGEAYYKELDDINNVETNSAGISYVKNQILVTAEDGVAYETVEGLANQINADIVGYIELTNDYQLEFENNLTYENLNSTISQLSENSVFEDVSLNTAFEEDYDFLPNDSKWENEWTDEPSGNNWGAEVINAPEAWEYYDQMSPVKVGVYDSQFDENHEDLRFTKLWNNNYTNLISEHGTHVAGTMAAQFNNGKGIAGIAPKTKLYGFSSNGTTSMSTIMKYKYALSLFIGNGVKVINISQNTVAEGVTNTKNSIIMGKFLEKLINKNYEFLIVMSAGNKADNAYNNNFMNMIDIPCVKNRIIVVGSAARLTNGSLIYSISSDYGNRVDIAAPGDAIYSTISNNSYGYMAGTSMAAPHVSGVAGMLFSVNSSLTGAQVKSIIVNNTDISITDSRSFTYNLLNAKLAVEKALRYGGTSIPVSNPNGIILGRAFPSGSTAGVSVTAYRTSVGDGNVEECEASTTANSDGDYELILPEGSYRITFTRSYFIPVTYYIDWLTPGEVVVLSNVNLSSITGLDVSTAIGGTVCNALTGEAVSQATVKFRLGWDNTNGDYIKNINNNDLTIMSSNTGNYTVSLPTGSYTAEITKDGFITGYVNIVSYPDCEDQQNAVLTPVLANNQYRVVLTWSDCPQDLDAHLTGPSSSGERFHIYYHNKIFTDSSNNNTAVLDKDDTIYYGPETITLTLNSNSSGVYRYSVFNFSNRSDSYSTVLASSEAQVKVYKGNSLVKTFNVPVNIDGNLWEVFELNNGEIVPVNCLSYESNSANIK